jgi:hypothetical protein
VLTGRSSESTTSGTRTTSAATTPRSTATSSTHTSAKCSGSSAFLPARGRSGADQTAHSNLGARNFLFLNVPPIDRSPLMQAQGASATGAEALVIADFNAKLAAAATAWGANHTGARTWLYDAHTAFGTILDNSKAYGFVDNTSYGGTGDFWGNNYHPASAASVMFGAQVGSLLANTVW